ncbi:hypothetical protein STVA_11070 [Allostella vacuolata]|nr:hypothetical protein STVA_11070 [Stella vacuolata]
MLIPKTTRTRSRSGGMDRDGAEALALRALAWIAADEDRLMRFLALTGTGLDEIRGRIADPAFLGGILDCLLGDEAWVTGFADETGIDPQMPAVARRMLPGGMDEAQS